MNDIISFIERHENEAFNLLEEIVNIDSPSREKEGTNMVGEILCQYLESFSIPVIKRSNEIYGDHIMATVKGSKPGKVLLMGHRDTVFPRGTVKERSFSMDEEKAYGPGVADMKAGLVTMVMAAVAIKQSKAEMCDIDLLFTPDEEIGSPSSRKVIEERAKDAIAVFNLEPGRPDGSIVTGRKGSAHLRFHIQGKAAHSGVNIEDGISAVEELSYKVLELKKLMDLEKGITVNVGMIEGGVNTNVVAPEAKGTIHIGFWSVPDLDEVMIKVREIIHTSYVPGTKSTLKGDISFLPMPKHQGVEDLYKIVQEAAASLEISVPEQRTKGAADAGFPASLGIPTICGMGPVGGNWHNEGEYMIKNTFIPRIKLLAESMVLASHKLNSPQAKKVNN